MTVLLYLLPIVFLVFPFYLCWSVRRNTARSKRLAADNNTEQGPTELSVFEQWMVRQQDGLLFRMLDYVVLKLDRLKKWKFMSGKSK